MTSRRTLPEIFIETLADMLRDERERKASRLSGQIKAKTVRFLRRLPQGSDESKIAVDRFPHLNASQTSGAMTRQDLSFSFTSQDGDFQD